MNNFNCVNRDSLAIHISSVKETNAHLKNDYKVTLSYGASFHQKTPYKSILDEFRNQHKMVFANFLPFCGAVFKQSAQDQFYAAVFEHSVLVEAQQSYWLALLHYLQLGLPWHCYEDESPAFLCSAFAFEPISLSESECIATHLQNGSNSVLFFSKFLSSLLWFSLAKTNTSSTGIHVNFKKSHIKGLIPLTNIIFLLSQLRWQRQNTFVHYLPRHAHCRISKKFDRKCQKKVATQLIRFRITDFLYVTNVMASTISR